MIFEFEKSMPDGCIDWLRDNVGNGNFCNYVFNPAPRQDLGKFDWEYRQSMFTILKSESIMEMRHIHIIEIQDDEKAMVFSLRWS